MDSNIWGPPAWTFLHSVTLNFPENPTSSDRENFRIFFDSMKNILPCEKCKEHYKLNLIENPIRLESREELVKWLMELHNKVNVKNNKPVFSYEKFIDYYSQLYNSDNSQMDKKLLFVIIIIFFLLILYASS